MLGEAPQHFLLALHERIAALKRGDLEREGASLKKEGAVLRETFCAAIASCLHARCSLSLQPHRACLKKLKVWLLPDPIRPCFSLFCLGSLVYHQASH